MYLVPVIWHGMRLRNGCRLIRGVDDGLVGDGLIAYGCGLIDSGSDMIDGLVVDVISGSSNGGM